MKQLNTNNKDFILDFGDNKISSAFFSFQENVKGKTALVNWFYTPRYAGKICANNEDGLSYKSSFKEWIAKCSRYIREGSTVIDIGAFTGDTTIPMAHLVGPTGKVFAFEPNPTNFQELSLNVAANPNLNIIISNNAIMEKAGEHKFLFKEDGNGGISGEGTWCTCTQDYPEEKIVKSIVLDEFLKENKADQDYISLIKVDTEGYDIQILYHNRDLILKNKSVIIMEWLPSQDEVITHFANFLRYKIYDAETHTPLTLQRGMRTRDLILIPDDYKF